MRATRVPFGVSGSFEGVCQGPGSTCHHVCGACRQGDHANCSHVMPCSGKGRVLEMPSVRTEAPIENALFEYLAVREPTLCLVCSMDTRGVGLLCASCEAVRTRKEPFWLRVARWVVGR